ncbi:MAG TPA: hypothetical protein VG870_13290 [Chitinophagaceae bacterium]|nr:hypothetical protein [Chitinophagaceae bacterium]
MANEETVVLIRGRFQPQEARDLLLALINHKINFHQMKNFSLVERFGKPEPRSQERIEELRSSRLRLEELIRSAQQKGQTVDIESTIRIELGS